jgi:2-dehydro-3-deoxyphosphogluconate aldolase/(4S)-4-hydroxy-2-oxoglutarate aldolase
MAQYSRIQVINKMMELRMVPLFYNSDFQVAKNILQACYNGGARLIEFTNRGDFAIEVFSKLIKFASKELPGMIVGIGSVTDSAAASQYMLLGANFVVTPVLREDIAIVCNRRKVLWIPGCGSLSEIAKAEEMGCELIKLFPGNVYGPDFIKSVKAPQPWSSIMPTGGVSIEQSNLLGWFKAGADCVGLGSKLIAKEILTNQDFKKLEKNVLDTLQFIKKIK